MIQPLRRGHRSLAGLLGAIALLAGLSLLLAGCGGQQDPTTLKIAVLPILDTLPMYVAEEEGFFADENVTVEFVPVTSAPQRDQVVQAGQADGMINELLSTMFYNADSPEVVTVSYAFVPTANSPHFYVLAAAESGITSLEELKGQPIGISEGTIIEYVTDRLLQTEGFSDEEINTVAVPGISDRMASLNAGSLAAATLPDPLAALAIQNGAVNVIDDSAHPEFGESVITFRKEVVAENPEAIRGFLAAIDRAVTAIAADKDAYAGLLIEKELVPPPLQGAFPVPDFPAPAVPPQDRWDDAMAWAQAKGYLEASPGYEDSVDGSFLP